MKGNRLNLFNGIAVLLLIVNLNCLAHASGADEFHTPGSEDSPGNIELADIPHPELIDFEAVVIEQLEKGRRDMEAMTLNPEASIKYKALAYGRLGHLYHAYELMDAAEACYHNAAVMEPNIYRWNYCYAFVLQKKGDLSRALRFYKKAQAVNVTSDLVYLVNIRIGDCYKGLNEMDRAGFAYEMAYNIFPEGPSILARMGETAFAKKEYKKAILYLTQALEKKPGANKLHYPLAMAFRHTGNRKLAKAHLDKRGIVGIQPSDPLKKKLDSLIKGYRIHVLAGKLAFSAGRYAEAAQFYEKAIAEDPEKAGARVDLGVAHVRLKQYEKGIESFERALELEPDNMTAHYNLGDMALFMGDYGKAVKHLTLFLEELPDDAVAHLKLATALRNSSQFEKALVAYAKAIELDSTLARAWLDLSSLLELTGYFKNAIHILEKAHKALPRNQLIMNRLARSLAICPDKRQRDGTRSLVLAQEAFNAVPGFETARTVAVAYGELDQCDNALKWMEKSMGLAQASSQPKAILELIGRNIEHFKAGRPCRIP